MNKIKRKDKDFMLPGVTTAHIIGFRNFVVHEYLGIRVSLVINILEEELPKLEKAIKIFMKK